MISVSALFLVIFISSFISGKLNLSTDSLKGIFLLVLGVSGFIGTLFYVYDVFFGPRHRIKTLKKHPFTEFIKIGFESKHEFLIGKIKKHTVLVGYHWRNHRGARVVYTKILFDPRINGNHINNYSLSKWQKSIKDDFNFWDYGTLTTQFIYKGKKTDFKGIIRKLEKNISLIENRGLSKIGFDQWTNEIENHYGKKN